MGNICVHAASDKSKPIAIIVPAEPALKKLANRNGIEGNSLEELVHNKKLNSLVLKELQATGREGGLNGIEIIDGVVMADEEWNAANVRKPVKARRFPVDSTDIPCSRVSPQPHRKSTAEESCRSTARKSIKHTVTERMPVRGICTMEALRRRSILVCEGRIC